MSIEVIKSGVLDTIQDKGRMGFAKWGINPNGAMDFYAMQMANALVGNDLHEGVIELHFPAGEYFFKRNSLIAITGADFEARVNDMSVSRWRSLLVRAGSTLSFKRKKSGARCYVAVQNGFAVPRWLNSASTNLKVSTGGLGRSIRKGDEIPLNDHHEYAELLGDKIFYEFPWIVNHSSAYSNPKLISVITGKEWSWLTHKSQQDFFSQEFTIGLPSDRMAYYLSSGLLDYNVKTELVSSGVTVGTIQGLPNGTLLILMADRQTTGGYPRIAHIVTADLPKLSQQSPNERITFRRITIEEAEKMLFSLGGEIRMVQQTCRIKLAKCNPLI
jgi:antagonist of KipI